MEHSNNYNHVPYGNMDPENKEFGTSSQGFIMDPTGHINSNLRPPEHSFPEAKLVHHYSIQTGEEFALEFMRDRVNPRTPFVPLAAGDSSLTTVHSEGIVGSSHLGSETGLGISALNVVEQGSKNFEHRNSSFYEDPSSYGSVPSVPCNLSAYSNNLNSREYASSGTSDDSSKKIKVLCSFGGKILPRPKDGKLRYVGGETRIIRISKEISWENIWQKSRAVYRQTHTIKYQLPGEDLDALVSVSSDEDLQNMVEECNVLGDGDGLKKLRMFLFSMDDLDDAHFGLANPSGDSEVQYVVAINGMSFGSRRDLSLDGLASSTPYKFDEPDAPNVEKCTGRVANEYDENNTSYFTDYNASPMATESSHPISPIPSNIHETHSHTQYSQGLLKHGEDKQHNLQYVYEQQSSNFTPEDSSVLLQSQVNGLPEGQSSGGAGLQDLQIRGRGAEVKGDYPSPQDYKHENSSESKIMHLKPVQPTSFDDTSDPAKAQQSKDKELYTPSITVAPEHASDSNLIDLSDLEPPVQSHFRSERYPREHAESLNRLTKSDDSLGSQFLVTQSNSDLNKDSKIAFVENSQGENLDSYTEQSLSRAKLTDPRISDTGLAKSRSLKDAAQEHVNENDALIEDEVLKTGSEPSATKENISDSLVSENTTVDRHEEPPLSLPDYPWADRSRSDISAYDPYDIFSKAMLSEDSPGTDPLQIDGALSLNMANHEPEHWSFFQKLAPNVFVQNDVSLMDQDHLGYSSRLPKVKEDASRTYKNILLANSQIPASQINSQNNLVEDDHRELPDSIVESTTALHSDYNTSPFRQGEAMQFDDMAEDRRMPDSEYEGEIRKTGLPPVDPSLGNFDISSLQIIKNEDLEELRELGAGTFGTVYHGKWRGTDVAIKRIKKSCFAGRSSEQERLTMEFWGEAEILSKLHHPNVVAFYGVVQDGPGGTLATVGEYMTDGSLRHVLLRKDRHLDHRRKLIIAMDAAFGMEYLHSKNIVHFDLKCDNLLVNFIDPSRPICKVADFGLSKIKRNTLVSGGVRGTLPWMAPELLNGGSNKVSEKVDVFSFGIVLWEILTCEEPYANMHYGAIIGGIVNNTLRPAIPSNCDSEWKRLMEHCWSPNPVARPSFTEITNRLRVMTKACQTRGQVHKASN
ncbi:dual specificity protein kinase splB [Heracleum sosnowskyi]|uniref:Dual specificity protein kinase splB n=1 Tax=Heracleum sosnowskyi TaxID=360622 RepID=A0AAD8HH34_9APIA|nr:dual specificity protein kinase splB [Heracleum sosnowskyi]